MESYIDTATSRTLTEEEEANNPETPSGAEYTFELMTGNEGSITIVEPLLKEEVGARQRAESEFLKNGYSNIPLSFKTWRTDFSLNQILLIKGLRFKVTSINIESTKGHTYADLGVLRYE